MGVILDGIWFPWNGRLFASIICQVFKLVATVITGSCHTTRSFYIGGPC